MPANDPSALIDLVYKLLKHIDHGCLPRFLAKWPSRPFKTRKAGGRPLPVLSHLKDIEVNPVEKSADVVKAVKSLAGHLSWRQTYTAADLGEAFLKNYGWTELIGARGPVASKDIACGFLLLGPNTEYPKHSHAAEEVYVPFNSQALWVQGDDDWSAGQSGVPIYHRPWMTHGMRTGSSPLLALYVWRGGSLVQKSRLQ
jgi:hypothetical protein